VLIRERPFICGQWYGPSIGPGVAGLTTVDGRSRCRFSTLLLFMVKIIYLCRDATNILPYITAIA
jgi:hypothetical protein